MTSEQTCLRIDSGDPHCVELFGACVVLGVLTSIRSGTLPPQAGMWTIGRPVFADHLRAVAGASSAVTFALNEANELDAIQSTLGLDAMHVALDRLTAGLEVRIAELRSTLWRGAWDRTGVTV